MENEVKPSRKMKIDMQKIEAVVQEQLVDFDAWFSSRSKQIAGHHYKEIIMADMKARGVAMMNSMAKFDEALAKYGIKLK